MKWNTKNQVIAVIAAICILGFGAYTSLRDYSFHPCQFDSGGWKSGNIRIRGEMIEDLRSRSLLRGMATNEVFELLGKPDAAVEGQARYLVDIGRRIQWRPFLSSLIVEFDNNSRVYRVEMVD